jgi:peptide/nickel transport system permease protein
MKTIWKNLKEMPISARIGLAIVVVNLLGGAFAPLIAPYGETFTAGDFWEPVSSKFLLGTDQLGRDMLSRLLYGARNTISIALITTFLAFSSGMILGSLAVVKGGWVDQIFSRVVDILMAFPTLILALIVISVMGTNTLVLVLTIALIASTRVFRLSRALAMDVEVMEFVEAARLRGEGPTWIIAREIIPNILPPLVAEFGLRFCFVFLFISSLSFLGLGLQPPTADWGSMVRENADAISYGYLIPLFPAAAIAILTVGVNLVVDHLLNKAAGNVHGDM